MSDQNAIKIVVDTNIWISFLIGKRLASLKNLLLKGNVKVYFSDELYQEIIRVIEYPRIKKFIPIGDFFELVNLFSGKIHFIQLDCTIKDCRDTRDNFLLELAVSANADYLVTGDTDLLALNPFRGVKIIKAQKLDVLCQRYR